MKKFAFTLVELLIVLIILAVFATIMISAIKPNNIKAQAYKKAGEDTYSQIAHATKSILLYNTKNYNLTQLTDSAGVLIDSADFLARLIELYKQNFILKSGTIDATYAAKELTNGTSTISGVKASDFTGFFIKNGTYFGIKLHGNCTTTTNYIYDPSTPNNKTRTNTCGLIFFDVNGAKAPNNLGVDQYILGLGKFGVN